MVAHYCPRLWKCTIGGGNSCAHEILECANVILPCILTISLTEAIPRYTEALIQLEHNLPFCHQQKLVRASQGVLLVAKVSTRVILIYGDCTEVHL